MGASKAAIKLEEEIAGLGDLPREDLVARWKSLYKAPPPKGISRALMIRAIAYRMQVKRWGGLKRTARYSVGMLGRTPDYVNVTFAGFAGQPSVWRQPGNEEGYA